MASEEQIRSSIVEMGYIMATPSRINPSYYRLTDETIIRLFISINHLLSVPKQPDNFDINSTNIVSTFVPMNKRRPELFEFYSPSDVSANIIEEDVEFEVLKEDFSRYELTNGLILSIKAVLAQVKKSRFYTKEGEPVYIVNSQPVISIKKKT